MLPAIEASEPTKTTRTVSWAVLGLAILVIGMVAVSFGPDSNGDLRNYHYYGGWALTNKHVGFDLAPGQLQTYHHPLLDAIFYRVLRWLNAYPLLFTFVWSVPQAIAVWMVFHIARLVFGFVSHGRDALAIAACVIGGSGAASLPEVGMSMSEAIPNVALMGAIWLILAADRAAWAGRSMNWRYGAAGLLAGTAAVLKLTTSAYLCGIVAGTLVLKLLDPELPRLRALLAFAAGSLVALAALGGPWWLAVWRAFGNPLFPYYNTIFHSPYFPDVNVFDRRFLPRTPAEWLAYPLLWAFEPSNRSSEVSVRDPRLFFEVCAALLLLVWALAMRFRGRAGILARYRGLVWCAAFVLAAYALWLKTFGILRYASALEMLSGLLVLGAILAATAGLALRWAWPRLAGVGVIVIGSIASLILPRQERQTHPGARLMDVSIPRVPPDSTIFLVGVFEGAFFAPFEPATVRFIGLNNNLMHAGSPIGLEVLIERAVASATGPFWSLSDQGPPLPPEAEASLAQFGLRSTADCRPATASIAPPMTLCRVERIPQS